MRAFVQYAHEPTHAYVQTHTAVPHTHFYGAFEAAGDGYNVNAGARVGLIDCRSDEGGHVAQQALLVRMHVVVDAVPGDCCSKRLTQFDV